MGVSETIAEAGAATDAMGREAAIFSRYLIGKKISSELIERYRKANTFLLTERASPGEITVLDSVVRGPWALPFLDAACGLVRPHHLLRKKLLIMTAILETVPMFTDQFLPPAGKGVLRLLGEMAWVGVTAVCRAILGVIVWGRAVSR